MVSDRGPAEQLEDLDPHRVAERLEELGLELPQALGITAMLVGEHAGTLPGAEFERNY
jgi:hypothetical protein